CRQAGGVHAGLEVGLLPVGHQHRRPHRRSRHRRDAGKAARENAPRAAAGEPLEKLLEKRLFGPLGMKDTTFYLTEKQLPRLAKSYKRTEKGELEATDIAFLNGKSATNRDRFPAPNG